MKPIKLDKIDKLFSRLVRIRDGWNCCRCGTNYTHNTQGLDCSHLWGRARKGMRWLGLNATSHCMGCHAYLTANPYEFAEWIKGYRPDDHKWLESIAELTVKITATDRKDIHEYYKAELKRVESEGGNFETAPTIIYRIQEAENLVRRVAGAGLQ